MEGRSAVGLSGRRLGLGSGSGGSWAVAGSGGWRLGQALGGGSFGEVYSGWDAAGREAAVKVELGGGGLLCQELRVLRAFSASSSHAAALLDSGWEVVETEAGRQRLRWLAMERLGRSLAELQRVLGRPLSLPSGLRLLEQGVLAVKDLHQTGFLHRDIKPGNMMVGRGERGRTVVLVDFGLGRRWRRGDGTGRARRARKSVAFRGSVRYASPAAHLGRELGRADDLCSLFYLCLELMGSKLPWAHIPASRHNLSIVGTLKQDAAASDLLGTLPAELGEFLEVLAGVGAEVAPDYARLRGVPADLLRLLPDQRHWDWDHLPLTHPHP